MLNPANPPPSVARRAFRGECCPAASAKFRSFPGFYSVAAIWAVLLLRLVATGDPARLLPFTLGLWAALSAVLVLTRLAKRVSWQNAVLASAATVLAIILADNACRQVFGPGVLRPIWPDDLAPRVFGAAVLIAARELARWSIRPWRGARYYGIGVILAGAALAELWLVAFEASGGPAIWMVFTTGLVFTQGFPLVAALVASAPWIIDKRPVEQPPDPKWLVIWAGLAALPLGLCPPGGASIALGFASLAAAGMAARAMRRN
jgi:hypothetical protein